LGLFAILAEKDCHLDQICATLNLAERPAKMLLRLCLSLNLIEEKDNVYSLACAAKNYLTERSPYFLGTMFDFTIENTRTLYSYDNLKRAVLSDRALAYNCQDWTAVHQADAEKAKRFTAVMHAHSRAAASAWVQKIDLSRSKIFLDIGGGSAIHSIQATHMNPQLRAVVLDLPPVCQAAREYVESFRMSDKIDFLSADFFKDEFPSADTHFYSDIFHDWSAEKCRFLAKKSFARLPPGGRILIHEMLDDGDFTVASASLAMLLWTEGQQYSASELRAILEHVGFIGIKIQLSFGYWSIISANKP
jgi:ubiquinone/menaquinone biosynthesis C-methylase UbiE